MALQFDFRKATYSVSGQSGISLDEAVRLWVTKYPSFEHFNRAVIKGKSSALKDFGDFMEEIWDSVEKITAGEAFKQKNAEMRRIYFDAIGVVELFKSVEPKLLDKKVIKKKRTRWDNNNDPYEYLFEDVYELYAVDPAKLYEGTDQQRSFFGGNRMYIAVRCWCTTTNREYWIYVPEEAALKDGYRVWSDHKHYDVIKAIAWTIRIDIKNPERIYRQGDIIVAKEGKDSTKVDPYHIDANDYLSLMYSET